MIAFPDWFWVVLPVLCLLALAQHMAQPETRQAFEDVERAKTDLWEVVVKELRLEQIADWLDRQLKRFV